MSHDVQSTLACIALALPLCSCYWYHHCQTPKAPTRSASIASCSCRSRHRTNSFLEESIGVNWQRRTRPIQSMCRCRTGHCRRSSIGEFGDPGPGRRLERANLGGKRGCVLELARMILGCCLRLLKRIRCELWMWRWLLLERRHGDDDEHACASCAGFLVVVCCCAVAAVGVDA